MRIDVDGNLQFIGRRLRFTKVFGNMVDLAEIELVAETLPGVRTADAVVHRDALGRNGVVLQVRTASADLEERSVLLGLKAQLSRHKLPSEIRITREVRT
jgi:acyl-CoA synthetase (AMP-forming)/AMP-acid ligase II